MVGRTHRGGNLWWIDAQAGASRWPLPVLPSAEPGPVRAGRGPGPPATLPMVWHALRWGSVARAVWGVRSATTHAPILVLGPARPAPHP